MTTNFKITINLLKFSTICVLLGRAYQYIFKSIPSRALMWSEERMVGVTKMLNITFDELVDNEKYGNFVDKVTVLNGWYFLLVAVMVFLLNKKNQKYFSPFIIISGLSLIFFAYLQYLHNSYANAMFWEHSLQFACPFLLIYYVKYENSKWTLYGLNTFIAITFISHGLYAMGIMYDLPGNFLEMIRTILHLGDKTSIHVLFIAGVLDLVVALLIFIPKTAKPALIYCAIWGSLTALARIVYGLSFNFQGYIWNSYLNETIVRIPHGLVPFLCFLLVIKANDIKNINYSSKTIQSPNN